MKRHYQYINISLNIILLLSEGSFFFAYDKRTGRALNQPLHDSLLSLQAIIKLLRRKSSCHEKLN